MRKALQKPVNIKTNAIGRANALLQPSMQEVEQAIQQVVYSAVELIPEISLHLLGSGGKRIRPILLLLMTSANNADPEIGIDLAVASELIHSSTLLHDDVVDRGHIRRGVAAAPQVYGNSASVLVGDYLMAKAFTLVVNQGNLDLLRELSKTISEMAEGEMLQLIRSGRFTLTVPGYEKVISGKTAGLFAWCCHAGASLATRETQALEHAREYGQAFGMAFQITDDILDYTAGPEQSGKDLANDLLQGKMTIPLLLACEEDHGLMDFLEEVVARSFSPNDCRQLAERVLATSAITRAREQAELFVQKALLSLESYRPSTAVDCLQSMATFVMERVPAS